MKNHQINKVGMIDMKEVEYLIEMRNEAHEYILSFNWCSNVLNTWYDRGLANKIAVFMVEIESHNIKDDHIWVIVGDLPPAYIDLSIDNGEEALKCYVDLMQEWVNNVLSKRSLEDCYPIDVVPSPEMAYLLQKRIDYIKKELINSVES